MSHDGFFGSPIQDSGGKYTPTLDVNEVTLLVVQSSTGEKYMCAKSYKLPIVCPDYIYDSMQAGYALNAEDYPVSKRDASTPTKDAKMLPPDVSMCSTIANDTMRLPSRVDDTLMSQTICSPWTLANDSTTVSSDVTALEQVDMAAAKGAAGFLDGCKLYLCGWAMQPSARVEKLRKLANIGGATRYNTLSEAVSHIVMGSYVADTISAVRSWTSRPFVVSAAWLAASIEQIRPADETPFLCVKWDEEPSRFARLLSAGSSVPESPAVADCNDTTLPVPDAVLQQYSSASSAAATTLPPPAPVPKRRSEGFKDSQVMSSQALHNPIFAGMFKPLSSE